MSGGKKEVSSSVQEAPDYAKDKFAEQAGIAQSIYKDQKDQPTVFQGERVAGFSPTQTQAMSGLGAGGLTQGGQDARDVYSRQSTGNNDAFNSMLDANSRDMRDQINRQAAGSGRYGSGAHQNLLTRDIGDMRNQAQAQNYFQNQNLQMSAADRLAQGGREGLANQMNMGGMQQQLEQARLNADQQQFAQEQQAPWEQLRRYNQALVPTVMGGSTTSYEPSGGLGGILGGAMGGASMGSMFGPWGTAGGGLIGGIGSMF